MNAYACWPCANEHGLEDSLGIGEVDLSLIGQIEAPCEVCWSLRGDRSPKPVILAGDLSRHRDIGQQLDDLKSRRANRGR